jgi:hypothetical protein
MSKPVEKAVKWVQNQGLRKKGSIPSLDSMYSGGGGTNFNKNWVHPPDALMYGRVDYTVKFLGEVDVATPKGTDVVKSAIQKIKFQLQVKRSQGHKIPRVSIQINMEGLNIVDPRTKIILHKYPLHRISFCADDKTDKRVFSFIAKAADSARHSCFVFLSDKLAEEITLSIGEAFDLAYRKFLETNGRELETKKQLMVLRKRIADLEAENMTLKQQVASYQRSQTAPERQQNTLQQSSLLEHVSDHSDGRFAATSYGGAEKRSAEASVEKSCGARGATATMNQGPPPLPPTSPVPKAPAPLPSLPSQQIVVNPPPQTSSSGRSRLGQQASLDGDFANGGASAACRRRHANAQGETASGADNTLLAELSSNGPSVGSRLQNLDTNGLDDVFDSDFDPRAGEQQRTNGLSLENIGCDLDLFGLEPFALGSGGSKSSGATTRNSGTAAASLTTNGTAFSVSSTMVESAREPSAAELESAISLIDTRLAEMRAGFAQGLSLGQTSDLALQPDFLHNIDELDPVAVGSVTSG